MTNNEAIEALNNIKDGIDKSIGFGSHMTQMTLGNNITLDAITMAIEALESREPKEPTNIISNYGYDFGLCPECRCNVMSADEFCSICGQALRWKK